MRIEKGLPPHIRAQEVSAQDKEGRMYAPNKYYATKTGKTFFLGRDKHGIVHAPSVIERTSKKNPISVRPTSPSYRPGKKYRKEYLAAVGDGSKKVKSEFAGSELKYAPSQKESIGKSAFGIDHGDIAKGYKENVKEDYRELGRNASNFGDKRVESKKGAKAKGRNLKRGVKIAYGRDAHKDSARSMGRHAAYGAPVGAVGGALAGAAIGRSRASTVGGGIVGGAFGAAAGSNIGSTAASNRTRRRVNQANLDAGDATLVPGRYNAFGAKRPAKVKKGLSFQAAQKAGFLSPKRLKPISAAGPSGPKPVKPKPLVNGGKPLTRDSATSGMDSITRAKAFKDAGTEGRRAMGFKSP